MVEPYTDAEIDAIRHLILQNHNPDDSELIKVSSRNPTELKQLIRRHLNLFLDDSIKNQKICSIFNSSHQNLSLGSLAKPEINSSIPAQQISLSLPPKFRAKTPSHHPKVDSVTDRSQDRIPLLPKCATSPSAVSRHMNDHVNPKIGSLAAVLHPSLGPAHVCRVLSKRSQNNGIFYLISFFQSELSPSYVPSEYLFELEHHIGFPLGNEPEFSKAMLSENVTVDWLLERIFSSAQNLVIKNSEVLFHSEISNTEWKPEPQQIQQVMFRCVSCAALLLTCYISCRWEIPKDKMDQILTTIFRTNPPKFAATDETIEKIKQSIMRLISITESNQTDNV